MGLPARDTTMKNADVIQQFVAGETGFNASTVSSADGQLFSYDAKIAEWDDDDDEKITVYDGWDGQSRTTSGHFSKLHDALTDDETSVEYETTHEPKRGNDTKLRWQ